MTDKITNLAQRLLPDDDFISQAEKFHGCTIPKIGDARVPPTIMLITLEADHSYGHTLFILDCDDFNDYDARCNHLKKIGRDMADNNTRMCAVCLLSEAWISRQTSKREYATAGEDPCREEVFVMFGQTLDGRGLLYTTVFHHTGDDDNIVSGLEPTQKQKILGDDPTDSFRSKIIDGLINEYLRVMYKRMLHE